ncbi:MAG TPA: hypothetical protein VIK50_08895 [Gemmatimonadaceae bacterium]
MDPIPQEQPLTFLERLRETFAQLADVIPAMLGALVILFAGYLLSKLIEQGAERLLHRIRLNQALERGGVMEAVERGGAHFNPTKVVGKTLFWIMMFGVIMVAATALGLESLTGVFTELVGYLPSLMSAIVIIIAGIVLGRFTGGLIMASAGAVQGAPTLARVGRLGVIMLSVFMALQELGIGTEIVTTAFAILFGAVAFGLALAFGLGNRDLAGQITREWYQRFRAESEAIAQDVAERELEEDKELENTDGSEQLEMIPAGDTGEMTARPPVVQRQ